MSTALFEVMRAATDRRNTVWAAALAFSAREPDADPVTELTDVIRQLVAAGDLTLARTSWSGAQADIVPLAEITESLRDDSQWHPRRLPWAKRLRLIATDQGRIKFDHGLFGAPAPILRRMPQASVVLELQSLSCVEALGMATALASFFVGSAIGFIIGNAGIPTDLYNWSPGAMLGWTVGGAAGMGMAMAAWQRFFPNRDVDDLPETVIPDQFNNGPDLTGIDRFGDPRF